MIKNSSIDIYIQNITEEDGIKNLQKKEKIIHFYFMNIKWDEKQIKFSSNFNLKYYIKSCTKSKK